MPSLIPAWSRLSPGDSLTFPADGVGPLARGDRYVYVVAPVIADVTVTLNRGAGSQAVPSSIDLEWADVAQLFPLPLADGEYLSIQNNSIATFNAAIYYHPFPDVIRVL